MDKILYTKEEIIKLIQDDNIELGYTIEYIAKGVFEYRKIDYINIEDYIKQNKDKILEILNNLKEE